MVIGGRTAAALDATRQLPKRWKIKKKEGSKDASIEGSEKHTPTVVARFESVRSSDDSSATTNAIFNEIDLDQSGEIDADELRKYCGKNNLPTDLFMDALDGEGKIRVQEMIEYRKEKDSELRKAFEAMDADKDGTISFNELVSAVEVMNEFNVQGKGKRAKIPIDKFAMKQFFDALDSDHSGSIDFNEFSSVFCMLEKKRLEDLTPYWSSMSIGLENGVDLVAENHKRNGKDTFGHFIAGFVAGFVSRTFTSPLDVVKARAIVSNVTETKTTLSVVKDIVAEDGPRGLFRGNLGRCLQSAPVQALNFYSFSIYKDVLLNVFQKKQLNDIDLLLAGSMAGVTSTIFTYPLDVVAMRLTVQKNVYKNLGDALTRIAREEGIGSLFKGIGPSLIGVFPYASVTYGANDVLQKVLKRNNKDKELGMLTVYLCGCASGWAGMTIAYPFEFLRRRMQLDQGQYAYKGMLDAMQTVLRTEGPGAFFKGFVPASQRIIPMSGITFLTYELVRRIIESKEE